MQHDAWKRHPCGAGLTVSRHGLKTSRISFVCKWHLSWSVKLKNVEIWHSRSAHSHPICTKFSITPDIHWMLNQKWVKTGLPTTLTMLGYAIHFFASQNLKPTSQTSLDVPSIKQSPGNSLSRTLHAAKTQVSVMPIPVVLAPLLQYDVTLCPDWFIQHIDRFLPVHCPNFVCWI